MPRAIVILNHALTPSQITELRTNYACSEVLHPPRTVQATWAGFNPDEDLPNAELLQIVDWLRSIAADGDYLVVQGDMGAAHYLVLLSRSLGMKAIYATTVRNAQETVLESGVVERRVSFQHVRFRAYPLFEMPDKHFHKEEVL